MTGFSALFTGASGMYASNRALEVVSQNIANANTEGYSRQRVGLATIPSSNVNSLFSGRQLNLSGVTVASIQRIRSAFYEATRAAAGARQGAINAEQTTMTNVQDLLQEPTDSGLQATISDFYKSWADLGNHTTDSATGAVVIQKGRAVTSQINDLAQGLADVWTTNHESLISTLNEVSQSASDLASLNGSIRTAVLSGGDPNDLIDQRDGLIRKIAGLVGAQAYVGEDGSAQVSVGGVTIVSGSWSQSLTLSGAAGIQNVGSIPPVISAGGVPVALESGTAAGYLAAIKTDMPDVLSQLDLVSTRLMDAVNALHTTGFLADGATNGDVFFQAANTDNPAFDIAVVPTTSSQLAMARLSGSTGTTDGSNAAAISDLSNDTTVGALLDTVYGTTGAKGPTETWRSLASALGVQVESLGTAKNTQDAIVAAADDAVEGDAGVNLDEEMTNMMLYQRSYAASAKVMTVADSMMSTLINMVGN